MLVDARLPHGATCEGLATLVLPDTAITAAPSVYAGYCRVEGVVTPSIRFEVRLADWLVAP